MRVHSVHGTARLHHHNWHTQKCAQMISFGLLAVCTVSVLSLSLSFSPYLPYIRRTIYNINSISFWRKKRSCGGGGDLSHAVRELLVAQRGRHGTTNAHFVCCTVLAPCSHPLYPKSATRLFNLSRLHARRHLRTN